MKIKTLILGLCLVLGGVAGYAAISPGGGDYYALDQREVATRLANARFPSEISDHAASSKKLVQRVYKRGHSEVVWQFSVAHQPLANFTAALEPDGDGTRVVVDLQLADSDIANAAAQDMGEGLEFVAGALKMGMERHIAATLTGEKFNERAFARDVAAYALTNPQAARNYLKRMKQLGEGDEDLALDKELEEAIEADAAWHGDAPMLDTAGAKTTGSAASGTAPNAFDPTPPKDGW